MILNLLKNLTCALFILTIIITSLISCNNDISNYEKFYSTSWLCHQKDNYEKFKIIIEKIKDVNKPSKNGSTALHSAVNSSCINNIKLLLDNGADPNKKDAIGNTPLHYAHKAEVIDLLLSKGASANIKNNENITPLENELIMCNYICARILIENNYKFTIDPAARQKILHSCSGLDKIELIKLMDNITYGNYEKKYLVGTKELFYYIQNSFYYSIASSYKISANQPVFMYDWYMARDSRTETSWMIGGSGIGEFIAFLINQKNNEMTFLNTLDINIINGNYLYFKKYNRIKKATFEIYGAQVRTAQDAYYIDIDPLLLKRFNISIEDNSINQNIKLLLNINFKSIQKENYQHISYIGKFIIQDIYLGENNDTCLSEINASIE